jgi:mRNA interferase HigB
MKVHLIKEQTIWSYCNRHPAANASFQDWLSKVKRADWEVPRDIEATFRSADLLGNGSSRVVFNIGGNTFRMVCRYKFAALVHLSIKWIGTHAEYNKLCGVGKNKKKRPNEPNQYTINLY